MRTVIGGLRASIKTMPRQYKVNGETIMPVRKLTVKGETFYQWGVSGKLYKNRADAEKQGYAIEQQGYRRNTQKKS